MQIKKFHHLSVTCCLTKIYTYQSIEFGHDNVKQFALSKLKQEHFLVADDIYNLNLWQTLEVVWQPFEGVPIPNLFLTRLETMRRLDTWPPIHYTMLKKSVLSG